MLRLLLWQATPWSDHWFPLFILWTSHQLGTTTCFPFGPPLTQFFWWASRLTIRDIIVWGNIKAIVLEIITVTLPINFLQLYLIWGRWCRPGGWLESCDCHAWGRDIHAEVAGSALLWDGQMLWIGLLVLSPDIVLGVIAICALELLSFMFEICQVVSKQTVL